MSNVIEFKEGAVCYAGGEQWFAFNDFHFIDADNNRIIRKDIAHTYHGFQLNTIKQGDYIEASELDTEQKYNDVVEVFGLFGFKPSIQPLSYRLLKNSQYGFLLLNGGVFNTSIFGDNLKRKLTYPQLMAIGELKRLEVEREKKEARECFVEALDETVAHAEKLENEWTDKHYDFNYQLTQEDIDKGHIRIDAYFVNRMWKVNSWDDTGAGFHIVKTIPRIANSKNPLERELIALHKQINALCKLHGVDTSQI